ncbi:MAG: hypothetical protein HeimC3_29620 [Candidatus Heimdallarchaeota archaeon LC_3]|nr:MAG: hypothetical protein HeimC3_29620 [Candidatus Heimdallarchaeota archaeon LC_3]
MWQTCPDEHKFSNLESKMKLKAFLLKSGEGIIDLLRSIDNPKRFEILSLLLDGKETSFSNLLEDTSLQKSALSNHLALLTERNLIDKKSRGNYQISFFGEILLQRLTNTFIEAKVREQENLVHLFELIGKKMEYIDEELILSTENRNLILKIVKLLPMRVVSFHATDSKTPEDDAAKMVENWTKEKGLLDDPNRYQVFEFNNPDPQKDNPKYGYEFWIAVPKEFEVEDDQVIKEFSGGLYAVMSCRGVMNIGPTWKKLVQAVNNSEYTLTHDHQWLENNVSPDIKDHDKLRLDLYCPIKE